MTSRTGNLLIGTSGWTCEDWRRRFYPEEIPRKDWLSWYAQLFSTTEINGSFYRTPIVRSRATMARAHAGELSLRLEGIEIHHPLEAFDGAIG
jgi:uncharacterized protein YecE (DUF72 family)